MVVVDTNVLAYLLLDGPYTASARALLDADPDWRSEPFIMVELTNVLATTMRTRELSLAEASAKLALGHSVVGAGLHAVDDAGALAAAAHFGVSAYDPRFLAVAQVLRSRLVTEDQRLRKAAPSLTCSLAEALAA